MYAIMESGTRAFLPGRNWGNTALEPTLERPPRLFTTRGGALRALRWWRKGRSYRFGRTGQEGMEMGLHPRSERLGRDMLVVEIGITVIG